MDSKKWPTRRRIRTINGLHGQAAPMATEEETSDGTPLDDVMEDIRKEIVSRVAETDREEHRDIYDALADE